MPCSAITLSIATVAAVLSVALLAIAFSTDNWLRIDVKREKLRDRLLKSDSDNSQLPDDFDTNPIYYTRTKGLWRLCFGQQGKPNLGNLLYLSPVETYCLDQEYYIPDPENLASNLNQDEMNRLHMARSMIALFILAFVFLFLAFWTGVAGCWRRSSGNITTTAILVLVSSLLSAGGMGLWHGVEYYEQEKLATEPYYRSWSPMLRELSFKQLDWSFYLAWISVGLSLVSATLFAAAASCLYRENAMIYNNGGQYLMTVYPQQGQTKQGQGISQGYYTGASPYYTTQGQAYPTSYQY